jgi:F-type H+-transporting ATPase subunit b
MWLLATEGEGEPNPLTPPLGEIIIGLIAFGLFCFVLMRYVWPRMEAIFQARQEAIEGGIRRAEEAQAEAHRALEQYRAQLADARTEAAQIRDNARAEGQRIIEELREEAQAESARIVQRGEEQLAAQRQQIIRELRGEIGTVAVGLAERIVGESLAEDVQRNRTVDRFLDELDGMAEPAGAPGGGAGPRSDRGPTERRLRGGGGRPRGRS